MIQVIGIVVCKIQNLILDNLSKKGIDQKDEGGLYNYQKSERLGLENE